MPEPGRAGGDRTCRPLLSARPGRRPAASAPGEPAAHGRARVADDRVGPDPSRDGRGHRPPRRGRPPDGPGRARVPRRQPPHRRAGRPGRPLRRRQGGRHLQRPRRDAAREPPRGARDRAAHAGGDAPARDRPPGGRADARPDRHGTRLRGDGSRRVRHVRFEGVSFRYPGSGRDVLRGLHLALPAGRSVALVGPNGAGKTTVVKLLARLYDPTAGRILVDGRDLGEIETVEWQRLVAAIFQDFVRYELPARDNVGFGALSLLHDAGALESAAARAGALEAVRTLPRGWDTILSRRYEGGAELSAGQWQRVALARAALAAQAGAPILVLDEPAANLDARAEQDLNERFLDITAGRTTLIVSHRFSTVRRADEIAVLEQGAVTERGTHEALVAAGGTYARLFALQAARYGRPGRG